MNLKVNKNKRGLLFLELYIKEEEKDTFIKRLILEGKKKDKNKYVLPLKYLYPLFKNSKNSDVELEMSSIKEFLEFSDEYEEIYYYKEKADAIYMRLWRENNCPYIYKYTLDVSNNQISKQICFQKLT
jgi:hypothetical protein